MFFGLSRLCGFAGGFAENEWQDAVFWWSICGDMHGERGT
jgi:hypothetical protein